MSDSTRFHGSGSTEPNPDLPEPSLAEQARTLVEVGGHSTLSTQSRKHEGFPFGSLMPYGLTEQGHPLFLISTMAMHTQNLQADPRCTLLIVQASEAGQSLGAGRISIMGRAERVAEADLATLRIAYLERNPQAANWIDYDDFGLYRLEIVDVYFVGGFGIMGWVTPSQYQAAAPDPLVQDAAGIIQHMNDDHVPAMLDFARYFGGHAATEAEMTGIDYLGFNLKVLTPEGYRSVRVPFPRPLQHAGESRQAMIDLVAQAQGSAD
ncbi:MAG: DUF2470 domain-containing protein [Planctomycetota bacterium]